MLIDFLKIDLIKILEKLEFEKVKKFIKLKKQFFLLFELYNSGFYNCILCN